MGATEDPYDTRPSGRSSPAQARRRPVVTPPWRRLRDTTPPLRGRRKQSLLNRICIRRCGRHRPQRTHATGETDPSARHSGRRGQPSSPSNRPSGPLRKAVDLRCYLVSIERPWHHTPGPFNAANNLQSSSGRKFRGRRALRARRNEVTYGVLRAKMSAQDSSFEAARDLEAVGTK
jgi:hypothetical protein